MTTPETSPEPTSSNRQIVQVDITPVTQQLVDRVSQRSHRLTVGLEHLGGQLVMQTLRSNDATLHDTWQVAFQRLLAAVVLQLDHHHHFDFLGDGGQVVHEGSPVTQRRGIHEQLIEAIDDLFDLCPEFVTCGTAWWTRLLFLFPIAAP